MVELKVASFLESLAHTLCTFHFFQELVEMVVLVHFALVHLAVSTAVVERTVVLEVVFHWMFVEILVKGQLVSWDHTSSSGGQVEVKHVAIVDLLMMSLEVSWMAQTLSHH